MEYPVFVDGARRCPPEDVGGPDGFMDFLEAILDPAHEEHRAMLDWYGGPFDPIRPRRSTGPFRLGEHGAAAARPARQPQERIAASEAMSPGGIAYRAVKRARLSRMTGGNEMPEGAPKSDDKDMKGQSWSAVEIHPLPVRRPGMGRGFPHCHNMLNRFDFSRLGTGCPES